MVEATASEKDGGMKAQGREKWKREGGRNQRGEGKKIERGAGRKEDRRRGSGGRGAEISPKKIFGREVENGKGKKAEWQSDRQRKRVWNLGRIGRWFFLIVMIRQRLGGVSAASENAQNREKKN